MLSRFLLSVLRWLNKDQELYTRLVGKLQPNTEYYSERGNTLLTNGLDLFAVYRLDDGRHLVIEYHHDNYPATSVALIPAGTDVVVDPQRFAGWEVMKDNLLNIPTIENVVVVDQ